MTFTFHGHGALFALGKDSRMELLIVTPFKRNFLETGGRCKIAENEFRALNTKCAVFSFFCYLRQCMSMRFFFSANVGPAPSVQGSVA